MSLPHRNLPINSPSTVGSYLCAYAIIVKSVFIITCIRYRYFHVRTQFSDLLTITGDWQPLDRSVLVKQQQYISNLLCVSCPRISWIANIFMVIDGHVYSNSKRRLSFTFVDKGEQTSVIRLQKTNGSLLFPFSIYTENGTNKNRQFPVVCGEQKTEKAIQRRRKTELYCSWMANNKRSSMIAVSANVPFYDH
jgi:hypothetical protein